MSATSTYLLNAPPGPDFRAAICGIALAVWLVAMGVLFWHFDASPHGADEAAFDPLSLPASPAVGQPVVLYFFDGRCDCERAAVGRIEQVSAHYGNRVRQWVSADIGVWPAPALGAAQWRSQVPAFPAVAIWDAAGQLRYFGPLHAGADCGSGNGYLESTLSGLFADATPLRAAQKITRCVCARGGA